MNEELKRRVFDRAFCKKFKLLVDRKIGGGNDPSKEKQGSLYVQDR